MNTVTQSPAHSRYRITGIILALLLAVVISGCHSTSRHTVRYQPEVEYEFYYYPAQHVYHDIHRNVYHYHDHDLGWVSSRKLPAHFQLRQQHRKKLRLDHRSWKARHEYAPDKTGHHRHKQAKLRIKNEYKADKSHKHKEKAHDKAKPTRGKIKSNRSARKHGKHSNPHRSLHKEHPAQGRKQTGKQQARIKTDKRNPGTWRNPDNSHQHEGQPGKTRTRY